MFRWVPSLAKIYTHKKKPQERKEILSQHRNDFPPKNPPIECRVTLEAQVVSVMESLFNQLRFFVEIMWPVVLFMGLVWLRRVNPLYRQHECEKANARWHISNALYFAFSLGEDEIRYINIRLLPQATSPTRRCRPQVSCRGSRESSAMPTTPASSTPPVASLPAWCPTTTTPCEHRCGARQTGCLCRVVIVQNSWFWICLDSAWFGHLRILFDLHCLPFL